MEKIMACKLIPIQAKPGWCFLGETFDSYRADDVDTMLADVRRLVEAVKSYLKSYPLVSTDDIKAALEPFNQTKEESKIEVGADAFNGGMMNELTEYKERYHHACIENDAVIDDIKSLRNEIKELKTQLSECRERYKSKRIDDLQAENEYLKSVDEQQQLINQGLQAKLARLVEAANAFFNPTTRAKDDLLTAFREQKIKAENVRQAIAEVEPFLMEVDGGKI